MKAIPQVVLERLRPFTVAARRLPGMVVLLEHLRRRYARRPAASVIAFDRDLALEVQLDEHMGSHLFWYGAYSRDILSLLDRLLGPGMTVLDVGANIGEITLAAGARVEPGGRVFAFEPAPSLATRLQANIARNRPLGIEVVPVALSDTAGRATLFDASATFPDGSRHGGVVTLFPSERCDVPAGETPVMTLDAFVEQRRLERLDLVKIDVEGAELAVLRGGLASLRRFQPWVIAEVQEETSRAAGYAQREILDLLAGIGYRFMTIGRRATLTALTVDTMAAFQNVLCVPPSRTP